MPSPTILCHNGNARVEECDVCIVRAGVAGLNVLFAANQYLSRDQKGGSRLFPTLAHRRSPGDVTLVAE